MHRQLGISLIFVVLSLAATGCGGAWSYNVMATPRAPGAEGTVQVERIEGGNRLVTVTFRHVPPPDRLNPNFRSYVMWFRDTRGQATKASVLEFDPGTRTGRATATTPMTQFVLIVTAEANGQVLEPSENEIFNQRVNTH